MVQEIYDGVEPTEYAGIKIFFKFDRFLLTNRPRNFFEKSKCALVNKSKHLCFIPFWNRKDEGFHMRLKSTSGRHFRLLKSLPVAQKSLKTILYAPQIKAYDISYPFRPRI